MQRGFAHFRASFPGIVLGLFHGGDAPTRNWPQKMLKLASHHRLSIDWKPSPIKPHTCTWPAGCCWPSAGTAKPASAAQASRKAARAAALTGERAISKMKTCDAHQKKKALQAEGKRTEGKRIQKRGGFGRAAVYF